MTAAAESSVNKFPLGKSEVHNYKYRGEKLSNNREGKLIG